MRISEQIASLELAGKGSNGGLGSGHEIPHTAYTQRCTPFRTRIFSVTFLR